jgi:hypothetical protein
MVLVLIALKITENQLSGFCAIHQCSFITDRTQANFMSPRVNSTFLLRANENFILYADSAKDCKKMYVITALLLYLLSYL